MNTAYWSVRRELWENRSIYIAPLVVEASVLFGFLISTFTLPHRMRAAMALDPVKQHASVTMPYNVAAGLVVVTAFAVGVFYCLDALHGERRDRSILFWKSLPVSDRTTVLSKASIPLVVLPLYIFAIILAAQLIILFLSTVILLGNAHSLAILWNNVKLFQSSIALFYALTAIALWHAPIYGWLLLVSSWAKRATFLWALLPFFVISVLEKIAFNSTHFASLLQYRVVGWFTRAFVVQPHGQEAIDPLTALTPGRFLATPGLWIGLIFAALFFVATVRLRRYREPI
jgi:ABC-2 type transport system permease protein